MSGSATYAVQKYTLATMISSATSYDYIMTRNSQRQLISTDFRNDMPLSSAVRSRRTAAPFWKNIRKIRWVPVNGSAWTAAMCICCGMFTTPSPCGIGCYCAAHSPAIFRGEQRFGDTGFLFLDKNGDFLTYTGTELPEGMTDEVIADAQAGALSSKNNWSGGEYFAVSVAGSQWSVIVICSTQSYRTGCRQIMQNGIALARWDFWRAWLWCIS